MHVETFKIYVFIGIKHHNVTSQWSIFSSIVDTDNITQWDKREIVQFTNYR